jgi:Ca2+-binding RTX toxin-like protein
MVFALTSEKRSSTAEAEKPSSLDLLRDFEAWLVANPSWLEDKGFGGIQAQVITTSATFPDLEFANPGRARAFDYWYESTAKPANESAQPNASVVADPVVSDPATGGSGLVQSEFVPDASLPIFWEEKVSEPIDVFDKAGNKTEYQSMYGDWSETEYSNLVSASGQKQYQIKSSGKSADYQWKSVELRDADNNLIESSFESGDGCKSYTKQTNERAADGSIQKVIVVSKGEGPGYTFESISESDPKDNTGYFTYSDSNGYKSSTERSAVVGANGELQKYVTTSKGSGPGDFWYESIETVDKDGNLTSNSYKDNSGYFSERTTTKQIDPVWGEVIVAIDKAGNESSSKGAAGQFPATFYGFTKYTQDWRAIEYDQNDSNGNSNKLYTEIKVAANGEKTFVQTYKATYADGTVSQWDTSYNDQWVPLSDGSSIETPLVKIPDAVVVPEPAVIPVIEQTSVDQFESVVRSASDVVSEQMVMGVKGQSDKLRGTDEDDVFMVNDSGDKIVAGQKGNSDSLMAEDFSLNLSQRKWDGIENAMLVGSEDLNLTGDTESNTLSGNGGDNVIRGGAGVDTLFGGGGEDVFVISAEKNSVDQVLDFESGEDKMALSGRVFKSLFGKDKQLKEGVIDEKLILDGEGVLWFDADGAGRKAAVKVAIIGVQDSLEQADFIYMT